jgi:hypothetical protein
VNDFPHGFLHGYWGLTPRKLARIKTHNLPGMIHHQREVIRQHFPRRPHPSEPRHWYCGRDGVRRDIATLRTLIAELAKRQVPKPPKVRTTKGDACPVPGPMRERGLKHPREGRWG